jgi:hypothetical protein
VQPPGMHAYASMGIDSVTLRSSLLVSKSFMILVSSLRLAGSQQEGPDTCLISVVEPNNQTRLQYRAIIILCLIPAISHGQQKSWVASLPAERAACYSSPMPASARVHAEQRYAQLDACIGWYLQVPLFAIREFRWHQHLW